MSRNIPLLLQRVKRRLDTMHPSTVFKAPKNDSEDRKAQNWCTRQEKINNIYELAPSLPHDRDRTLAKWRRARSSWIRMSNYQYTVGFGLFFDRFCSLVIHQEKVLKLIEYYLTLTNTRRRYKMKFRFIVQDIAWVCGCIWANIHHRTLSYSIHIAFQKASRMFVKLFDNRVTLFDKFDCIKFLS